MVKKGRRIQAIYRTKVNLDKEYILSRIDLSRYYYTPVKRAKLEGTVIIIQLIIRPADSDEYNLQVSFNGTMNVTCTNLQQLWEMETLIKKITELDRIELDSIRMKKEEKVEYISKKDFLEFQLRSPFFALADSSEHEYYSFKPSETGYGVTSVRVSREEKLKELREQWLKMLKKRYPIE